MADLPKEWEAVNKAARAYFERQGTTIDGTIEYALERAYALHNQPQKELTDAEIDAIYREHMGHLDGHYNPFERAAGRAIEAAAHAKQREPEIVEFRAARRKNGQIEFFPVNYTLSNLEWQWLDHDGKPQTARVVLS